MVTKTNSNVIKKILSCNLNQNATNQNSRIVIGNVWFGYITEQLLYILYTYAYIPPQNNTADLGRWFRNYRQNLF